MKKLRVSSDEHRRRRSRSTGSSFSHRAMRCEQLETRCLMHGMPWQTYAAEEFASTETDTDRAAYVSTASSDTTVDSSNSDTGLDQSTLHQCDVNRGTMFVTSTAEGEGAPPMQGAAFNQPFGMRPLGRERFDTPRGGLGGRIEGDDLGFKNSLVNDVKSGLVPDNSVKSNPTASNVLPTSLVVNLNQSASSPSNQPGNFDFSPPPATPDGSVSRPASNAPLNLSGVGAGSSSNSLQSLGELLTALKGNVTSPQGNAIPRTVPTINLDADSANTASNAFANSMLASGGSAAGLTNNKFASGTWQSLTSSDQSAALATSSAMQSVEASTTQESLLRASFSGMNDDNSASRSSTVASVDDDQESSGLLRELRAQIERLARQRETERSTETGDENSSAERLVDNQPERKQHRVSMILANGGLLELSHDRPFDASQGSTIDVPQPSRDMQAHAAAFAAIGMYREFDLLVDASDATVAQPTTPVMATASRESLKLSKSDESAAVSDAEPSLADRALLPLSFLALGGLIFRRRKMKSPR